MTFQLTKPKPPTDDKRWKMIDVTMRRSGYAQRALIETLHRAQGLFGFLDNATMQFVAESLSLPLSKVYGVATFYHLFALKPKGKHTCVVCTGTACYIKGADKLAKSIQDKYHAAIGETTDDEELSVMGARCIGACSLAPAAVVDGTVMGNLKSNTILEAIEKVI